MDAHLRYLEVNNKRRYSALVKKLGEGADSLCAVGDEDQSIYRWRGAEVEHILRHALDHRIGRFAIAADIASTTGNASVRVELLELEPQPAAGTPQPAPDPGRRRAPRNRCQR